MIQTAKEEAEELVAKFSAVGLQQRSEGVACALIAVDYLIAEQTMWQNGEPEPVLYWQEIKQELEKLK